MVLVVEARGLAVEAGGDRLADRVASHADGGRPTGPAGSPPAALERRGRDAMDELTQLALAAGAGDRVATTAFVRRTQPEVWRVCARLGDRADADDLTQEVYLRALPALAAFRGESSARTWLLQIARYVCADHVRRPHPSPVAAGSAGAARGHRARVDGASAPASSTSTTSSPRLDRDRREAFVLTQVAGLSYAEAALGVRGAHRHDPVAGGAARGPTCWTALIDGARRPTQARRTSSSASWTRPLRRHAAAPLDALVARRGR